MTINLLKVAALPMGGGSMAALPAEKNEPIKVQMKAEYFQEPEEVPLPKIDTVDEMATKLLAAVQRAH